MQTATPPVLPDLETRAQLINAASPDRRKLLESYWTAFFHLHNAEQTLTGVHVNLEKEMDGNVWESFDKALGSMNDALKALMECAPGIYEQKKPPHGNGG